MASPKLKISTLSVIILAAVGLGGLGYLLEASLSAGSAGTRSIVQQGERSVYDQPVPIQDFTLTDQTGRPFTLSSARGKIVLMAFVYTHCGDVCPYLAIKMKLALERLGDRAKDVELVAVDTDPERDTVGVLAKYSKALGLYDQWHVVTGSVAEMKQVYQSLKITVIKSDDSSAQQSVENAGGPGITPPPRTDADSYIAGLSDAEIQAGSDVARQFYGGYQIVHSAPFLVIDTDGNLRTSLDFSATPAQLADGVNTYLKKP